MSNLSTLSDIALMRRAQAGHDDCFAELARRYQTAMLRMAGSRLGRRALAEEAVQETFMAAFKGRATFDPSQSFRTWLWTILLNQCRSHLRRSARRPRVQSWSDAQTEQPVVSPTDGLPSREPAPWDRMLADERRERLDLLLCSLSPAQADALRLRFFGGLKFQEIADTMGCSLGTAKNRVRWGLLRLTDLNSRDAESHVGASVRDQGV